MATDKIGLETIGELLAVTLFSVYAEIVFALWMPVLCYYPDWLHLILQFWFIGLPQATIIIIPQYSTTMYLIFGVFGILGGILSYLR